MPRFWKDALSTRRAMQRSPHMEMLRELSDEEVRQLQGCFLEIIKDVIEVCEKYHICYMAAGGTALGSVRHKGFIPWDDDVDLLMPREDLNRFVEIFDEALSDRYEMTSPNSKYPLESMISAIYKKNTRKTSFMDFNTPFPKGVHIDIFAIESVPRESGASPDQGLLRHGHPVCGRLGAVLPLPRPQEKGIFLPRRPPAGSTTACV